MPLQGPITEILLRRSLEAGGKGPLFWKYNAERHYPDQLKKASRNFRELRQPDLRRRPPSGARLSQGLASAAEIFYDFKPLRRRG